MIYTLNNLNIIHLNDIYKPDFPPHIYYIIYSNAYQGYNHVKNHFFDDMPNLYIFKIIYNISGIFRITGYFDRYSEFTTIYHRFMIFVYGYRDDSRDESNFIPLC